MSVKRRKEYELCSYYEQFIDENKRNKRLMAGGRKLSKATVTNYLSTYKLLKEFEEIKDAQIIIRPITGKNKRTFTTERNKWIRFYREFTNYLYDTKGLFDNYVGFHIKNIRTFFNWLQDSRGIYTGNFHKSFHVWKEEIPIIVLHQDQLEFLIRDQEFHASLPDHLRKVKDFFVFGCTVALRFSDLVSLKRTNIEVINGHQYLNAVSRKTQTPTKIKLPIYAVQIIERNRSRSKYLLPQMSNGYANKQFKELMRRAGYNHTHVKLRKQRGKMVEVYKDREKRQHYKFCELITTHTMRRTAITTMLRLGMDEQMVRKISGHAPASVEFYRYVKLSQQLLDEQVDMVFGQFN